ncbi:MAG: hypothetical protein ACKO9T_04750 [Nitrospira sp.]
MIEACGIGKRPDPHDREIGVEAAVEEEEVERRPRAFSDLSESSGIPNPVAM